MPLTKHFLQKSKFVLAIVAATLLLTPARSYAETKTAQSGKVKAEFSYQLGENGTYTNQRLKIMRAGQTILDTALPVESEFERPIFKEVNDKTQSGFQIRNLDKDTEPEIITDFYTGGAHCCTYSLIYSYKTDKKQYTQIKHFWGNGGYRFSDLDKDGVPEFSSRDDRFAYAFTAYAASAYPLQIWQYRDGKMVDITRQYPKQIYAHAYQLWQFFEEQRKSGIDPQGFNIKGILAAYLGDKYLLGQSEDGWKRVRQVYKLSNREEYFQELQKFFQENGYTTNSR